MPESIYAGIDSGSRMVKIVLIDHDRAVRGSVVLDQGVDQAALASSALHALLEESGYTMADLAMVVATGYGRDSLDCAGITITEITCHARGVLSLHPDAMTVIDIGGQDSKLIRMDGSGRVRDFVMNDRCAAGTGRFLEVVSKRLDIALEALGAYAEKADAPAAISSMCVVFAESEIIGLLAGGASRENIIAGVQTSIASRVASMGGRSLADPVYVTGGVAMIPGMVHALEAALDRPVTVAQQPQLTGALGAALLAKERRQEAGPRPSPNCQRRTRKKRKRQRE
ncbi:2-hydroxyglutaryl-CoA dehydratase [bacterium]|nr:2-hydroxyglutaryl-CoA dehydratase [bacterium]